MTVPTQPVDRLKPFEKSWAVIIGINHYRDGIPTLTNAVNDAGEVARTLQDDHGYEVIQLLDGEATRERINALLYEELPAKVQEGHRVLFYWAGHGVRTESDTGPDGYLLPCDAILRKKETYLHMPGVHDALLDLQCRHMMVVLDTCFSGAFRWSGMRSIVMEKDEVVQKKKFDRFVKDPAWQVISSASSDETAADAFGTRPGGAADGHSPFAHYLFEALKGAADRFGGERKQGDGMVTAHELWQYVDAELGKDGIQKAQLWPLKKHGKGEFIFFVKGRELLLEDDPVLDPKANPWRGLKPYEEGDADIFYGRKRLIEGPGQGEERRKQPKEGEAGAPRPEKERRNRRPLLDQVQEERLTVVYGASGTGKTSIVQAGLIPRMRGAGWHVLPVMRPGASPLKALLKALEPDISVTTTTEISLGTGTHAVPAGGGLDLLRRRIHDDVTALLRKPEPVLLVIDRFEELITLATGPVREEFLAFLQELLRRHERLHLVVTLRSDFEPGFRSTRLTDRSWEDCRFRVDPMSREDLRAVIEMPAAKRVLYFEPQLVEKLLEEVAATPGALPLLSFALSEMYLQYLKGPMAEREITEAEYAGTGGVVGALQRRADRVYADPLKLGTGDLPSDETRAAQESIKHLMLRLVVREGGHLAGRRVVTGEDLVFPDPEENARIEAVMSRLEAAGLLVRGGDGEDAYVQPAHDALVRQWAQLKTWVREEDEASGSATPVSRAYSLERRQRLARAAGEWEDSQADRKAQKGLVWSDAARSEQLEQLLKPRAPWLNLRELNFAEASAQLRAWGEAKKWTRRLFGVGLTATALVFGVRATVLAAIATSRQLAAETRIALDDGNLDRAALLAVEASTLPAPSVRSPLLTWQLSTSRLLGYLRDTVGVHVAAVSPDGRTIASSAETDTLVTLWDVETRERRRSLAAGSQVLSLVFSPVDSTLAVATTDGGVILWDVGSDSLRPRKVLQPRGTPCGIDGAAVALTFSPDGGIVAWANDSTIVVWDLEGPRVRRRNGARTYPGEPRDHPGSVAEDAAFNDRRNLSRRGRLIDSLKSSGTVRDLTFGPDGQTLAAVTEDGVTFWRIARRPGRVVRQGETFWSISDENPLLWPRIYQQSRADTLSPPHWIYPGDVLDQGFETTKTRFRPMRSVTSLAFSPDGRTLAVAAKDTTVTLWDLPSWRPREILYGHTGGATSVAFNASGDTVAVGTTEGKIILWDITQRGRPSRISEPDDPLYGHADAVTSLSFRDLPLKQHTTKPTTLPILISTSEDDKVIVWSVAAIDSATIVPAPEVPKADSDSVYSPDGSILAIAGDSLVLWDMSRAGQRTRLTSHPLRADGARVTSLAFSSTGTVAVGYDDGWLLTQSHAGGHSDVSKLARVRGHQGPIVSLAYSPDGEFLASGHDDGTIIRRRAFSLRKLGSTHGHTGEVRSVVFGPDGETLVSGGADGTIRFWEVETMRRRGTTLRLRDSAAVRSIVIDTSSPPRGWWAGVGDWLTVRLSSDSVAESLAAPNQITTLTAVSDTGVVTRWDVSLNAQKQRACATAGRNLTESEWRESFGGRYERACGQFPPKRQPRKPGLGKALSDAWGYFFPPEGQLSGTGWRSIGSGLVGWLSDSPRLLGVMAWAWLLLLIALVPWGWGKWQLRAGTKRRRLRRAALKAHQEA